MAFIGCGKCNIYYAYIFALVLFKFLSDYLEGFNEKEYYNRKDDETFVDFALLFGYHPLMKNLVYALSALISGIILYIIYLKNEGNRRDSFTIETALSIKSQIFGQKNYYIYFDIILTSFIYVMNFILRTFLASLRFDAGFWTIEIIFIIYLSYKILKNKIGNHQIVTIIILAIISFSIQVVNSFLPKTNHNCKDETCLDEHISDNNLYVFIAKKFGNYGYIVLILFFYILHFMMRDYSWVRLKYLLDIKSKPMFKILLYIGIIGCILVLALLFTVTNVPCNVIENVIKNNTNNNITYIIINNNTNNNETVDFVRQVCGLIDYDESQKRLTFYYDNYKIFFRDYRNSQRKIVEIIIIPVYIIINIAINFCSVMILKYVNANAMLVNINFNYLLSRMIMYIKNKASEEYLTITEFVLLELCEILAILAYMIYIELIELKFCKLDYHLKKKIAERATTDSKLYLDENDDENINEPLNSNEDEKNEENKNDGENSDDINDDNLETNEVN